MFTHEYKKPFSHDEYMKYLGGKQRLGKHLQKKLHEIWAKNKLSGYMEPFCGSLGVLKHMTDINTKKIIANDYHPDLIQLWLEVQRGTFKYPESISEDEYNEAKSLESPNAYKAFVGFGMSFGGRFFGAYSQKYLNGKKEDFCKEMVNSLKRTKPLIQNVSFINKDYKKCIMRVCPRALNIINHVWGGYYILKI